MIEKHDNIQIAEAYQQVTESKFGILQPIAAELYNPRQPHLLDNAVREVLRQNASPEVKDQIRQLVRDTQPDIMERIEQLLNVPDSPHPAGSSEDLKHQGLSPGARNPRHSMLYPDTNR